MISPFGDRLEKVMRDTAKTLEDFTGFKLTRRADLRPGDLIWIINGNPDPKSPKLATVINTWIEPRDRYDAHWIAIVIEQRGLNVEEFNPSAECYLVQRHRT